MKRICLVLTLVSAAAVAQTMPVAQVPSRSTNLRERAAAPSYTDMYCSGFLSKQSINKSNYVLAGLDTPQQTQFSQGDTIYLEGSGYQEGARFSVLRELRDPNVSDFYPGQRAAVASVGQPYGERGRVRVIAVRDKVAIAQVEFSCSDIVAGDLVVPFEEKPSIQFRPAQKFDQFPTGPTNVTARIVMAHEFDTVVAPGQKVYLNVGADKGVKIGDYFRVVRGYDPAKGHRVEALAYKMPYVDDTQKTPLKVPPGKYASLPRHVVAEMIVLNVTATSATAMITNAVEHVNVGDTVELEGGNQQ